MPKKDFKFNKKLTYIENKNIQTVKQIFKNIDGIIKKYQDKKVFAFGYGKIAKTIVPYTNLDNYISFYIDDYVYHKKVITSKESQKLFQEVDNVILLLLVNPIHAEKIKQLYIDFKNINFINIFDKI
jgi:hypothetical protein